LACRNARLDDETAELWSGLKWSVVIEGMNKRQVEQAECKVYIRIGHERKSYMDRMR
jgi:hypothetical protein